MAGKPDPMKGMDGYPFPILGEDWGGGVGGGGLGDLGSRGQERGRKNLPPTRPIAKPTSKVCDWFKLLMRSTKAIV